MRKCALTAAVEAGFQTTVLPISATEVGRLPAIEVKLNGVTAKTKPSKGRYSRRFQTPGEKLGRSEEDGGAVLPRRSRPVLPGVGRSGDRAVDLGRAALVDVGEDVAALVRHDRFERVAGLDVLAADH